jgi:hypothetical protein
MTMPAMFELRHSGSVGRRASQPALSFFTSTLCRKPDALFGVQITTHAGTPLIAASEPLTSRAGTGFKEGAETAKCRTPIF